MKVDQAKRLFIRYMADHPPAVVAMEACGSAHFWTRVMTDLGHEVRLVAPQYVRHFVKRQKNDAADAEAIMIAAQRPEMRFVAPKTEEQQEKAVVFRARQRLLNQRTELINALRSILYEHGLTFPAGAAHIGRIEAALHDLGNRLHPIVREECLDLMKQTADQAARIDAKTKTAKALAKTSDTARRLQTMPGGGPVSAMANETFAPPMDTFKCGRGFAAWLGLVPRQFSSGGKIRLRHISNAG